MGVVMISIFLFFLLSFTVFAQEEAIDQTSASKVSLPSGTVDCFEVYEFMSVGVSLNANHNEVSTGTTLPVTATITNKNDYPMTDGTLFIKVYKEKTEDFFFTGHDLVDEFLAVEDIALRPNETKEISFEYAIPANQESGQYQLSSYFLVDSAFNYAGLTFTDDITASTLSISIQNQEIEGGVAWQKEGVTINGEAYKFVSPIPQYPKDETLEISLPLINTTDQEQTIEVETQLFFWDSMQADNGRDFLFETLTLAPGEQQTLTKILKPNGDSVQYLKMIAHYKDAQSIVNIRVGREGEEYPRFNSIAIDSFPKKGESIQINACAHVAKSPPGASISLIDKTSGELLEGDSEGADQTYAVKLVYTDEKGNNIGDYTYTGIISGGIIGLRDSFVLEKEISRFNIEMTLNDPYAEKTLEKRVISYDCRDFGSCPSAVFSQGTMFSKTLTTPFLLAFGFGLFIILTLFFLSRKKRKNMKKIPKINVFFLAALLGFSAAVCSIGMSVPHTHAAWTKTDSVVFSVDYLKEHVPVEDGCLLDANAYINIDNASVLYRAESSASYGTVMEPGDQFNVRDITANGAITYTYSVTPNPGFDYDTPYGCWGGSCPVQYPFNKVGEGTAYFPEPVLECGAPDYGCDYTYYIRGNLSAEISVERTPTTFRVAQGPVQCSQSGSCRVSDDIGSSSRITVCVERPDTVEDITVSGNIEYGSTYEHHNCRDNDVLRVNKSKAVRVLGPRNLCFSYDLAQEEEENNPPTPPNITGPSTLEVNQRGYFSIRDSRDPEGDNIYYQVRADGGPIETSPNGTGSGSYVYPYSKAWATPGVKTISARACDIHNACSVWRDKGVTIEEEEDDDTNRAPTSPVIDGPEALMIEEQGDYIAKDSRDVDGDRIYYRVRIDSDPITQSPTGSGNGSHKYSFSKTWSNSGTKLVSAQACDVYDKCSSWTRKDVAVSDFPPATALINGGSCDILKGQSTCQVAYTWEAEGLQGDGEIYQGGRFSRGQNIESKPGPNVSSGGNINLSYVDRYWLRVYDSTSGQRVQDALDSARVSAQCASGLTWNGITCEEGGGETHQLTTGVRRCDDAQVEITGVTINETCTQESCIYNIPENEQITLVASSSNLDCIFEKWIGTNPCDEDSSTCSFQISNDTIAIAEFDNASCSGNWVLSSTGETCDDEENCEDTITTGRYVCDDLDCGCDEDTRPPNEVETCGPCGGGGNSSGGFREVTP